jgi:tetratricopeptide (TPR) repeat protein
MSERYAVRRLDEIGSFVDEERAQWHPIRAELGITAFGVNAWRAGEVGQELIEEHDEVGGGAGRHEELYLVLAGRATFTVDGEIVDAPAGQLVFCRNPEVKRAARAEEAGTVVLVAGGRRGEAFTVSQWEKYAEGLQFFAAKEYAAALDYFERAHSEAPEQAGVLYNLACAESLMGRPDDALAHLQQAVELTPSMLEAAQTDSDLDAIRADPRFPTAG